MNEVKFKANKKDLDNVKTIPAPAAANAGQVLKVNDSGAYALVNDNIFKAQISGGESKVFSITPTFRAMVVGFGAHGAQRGAYLHIITESALTSSTITAASDYTFTYDSTTKKLTVENGYSGSGAYLMWIIYNGAISEDPAPETSET